MTRVEALSDDRIAFNVRVVPRADRSQVIGWTGAGELKVRVTAPPVDESANRELLRLLARSLGVRRRDIDIISGPHSRTKRLSAPKQCENRLLGYSDI